MFCPFLLKSKACTGIEQIVLKWEGGCYTRSDGPYIGLISEQNDIVYSKQNTYLSQSIRISVGLSFIALNASLISFQNCPDVGVMPARDAS